MTGEQLVYEMNRTVNGVKLFTVSDYDYAEFKTMEAAKQNRMKATRTRPKTMDLLVSFDIETSKLPKFDQSFMYVWQVGVGFDKCIIGRTWQEFKTFLLNVVNYIPDKHVLKIWVHNLAYEFSFLKGIYRFMPDDVFILDGRRVVRATMMEKIQFQCSYIQTNMSLADFTKQYNVTHSKLSGDDFDYNKVRYPWDELEFDDLQYCVHDVIGLNEAISARLEAFNDTLFSIPLTSTGYVRREVKKATHTYARMTLPYILPEYDVYCLLEEAFRGGNTHANRHYVGEILEGVTSVDIQSSYPYQMACKSFPMGVFKEWCKVKDIDTVKFLQKQNYACLIVVEFYGLQLRHSWFSNPYISISKCRSLSQYVNDNGRVLSCSYCKLVVTELDLEMIEDIYTWDDLDITELYYSKKGALPKSLTNLVLKYFQNKTELKGIDDDFSKTLYMKSKNLLNSIYGMMAQKPVKQNIDFLIDEELQFNLAHNDRRELYEKYCKNPVTSFAWGVWVTAHARHDLHKGMKLCGKKLIYVDTDCCKFLTDKKILSAFQSLNEEIKENARKHKAVAIDAKGNEQFLGVWDDDGQVDRFITHGAKKYASETDGKIKITVAGVNKKKGAEELKKRGGLKSFKTGFVFRAAGGSEAVYNDHVLQEVEIDGHDLLITDNVCLLPSTYTLGYADEYRYLLDTMQKERY